MTESNDALFDDAAETEVDADARGSSEAVEYALEVVEGPSQGERLTIGPDVLGTVLVGQTATCALRLADRGVSRRHISLELVGRRLRLVDLRSTNGTIVDGVAVEVAYLRGGELVRIGGSAIQVDARPIGAPAPLPMRARFGRTVGASVELRKLYRLCERLAQSDVPVLIEGETGTGKEALAESIHAASKRAGGPFVVFDCTAVPATLFESELFGHERGAFTGATQTRAGVFEQAQGGTLLIDEIGDLDPPLQAKLLRAVETQSVRRVGGERTIRFDVRILAATRRDLDREVQAGRFRDDLYHRLAVGRVELPPLRRRAGDVRLLARHFWSELGGDAAGPPEAVIKRWEDHGWPGNVRELRNAVSRQIALGDLDEGRVKATERAAEPTGGLDAIVSAAIATRAPLGEARDEVLRAFEKRYVEALADKFGGDLDKVAAAAGIGRRYLNMIRARTRR